MPKASPVQTNFTGGEISPRLLGRSDLKAYPNAVKAGSNVVVLQQGGARLKPGSDFVGAAKNAGQKGRLIRFVYSQTQAYELEFGDLYVRVWKDDVYTGTELATPYTEAMVPLIDYSQGADTMFLACGTGTLPIYRLQRFSDTSWVLEPAPIDPVPFDEIGTRLPVIVTLSAATVGAGRTATAASPTWNVGDVGRRITLGGGRALITAFTDTTHVTVTVEQAFASVTLGSNAWVLEGSPQSTLASTAVGPVGATVILAFLVTGTLQAAKAITVLGHDGVTTATATITGHGYITGDIVAFSGNAPDAYNVTSPVTVLDPNTLTYQTSTAPGGPATILGVAQRTASVGAGSWRSGDVGRFVKINGGLCKVTSIASSISANAEVVQVLSSLVSAPPGAWSLNSAIWNADDGYPRTVTLHEQRLWVGGSPKYPARFNGSATGLYLDFTLGTNDDDAIDYTIGSDEQNAILFLSSGKDLIASTLGPHFVIKGGVEKPITPTNISVKPHSSYGCEPVRPELVGDAMLFVQRGNQKLRALAYAIQKDGYAATDIGAFSEHIPGTGITAMAVALNPEPIVWLLLGDGTLAALTYSPEQEVICFTRCPGTGTVESVSSVPDPVTGEDAVHLMVKRTIDGVDRRYIERLNFDAYQDCRTVITQAASTTVAGLTRYEGTTVGVVGDGVYLGEFGVSGGQITGLPRAVIEASVGYTFTGRLELLPPDVGSGIGTSQAQANSQHHVWVRVKDTVGCTINGQEAPGFQAFDGPLLDTAPATFSGLVDVTEYGWDADSPLVLEQPRPYPWEILAVIRGYTSNAG